jgi:hypothetical protein
MPPTDEGSLDESRLQTSLCEHKGPLVTIPTTTMQKSRRAAVGPQQALRHVVIAAIILFFALVLGLTRSSVSLPLREVAIVACVAQAFVAYGIARLGPRLLSVSTLFAALWIVYFPLRLLIITLGGPSVYYFPAVNAASANTLIWVWDVTTSAVCIFLIAAFLIHRRFAGHFVVHETSMAYGQFLAVGLFGIVVTAGLQLFHASSGILGNLGQIMLFSVAGASFMEKRQVGTRKRYASLVFVIVAVALGYSSGLKELMLMPIVAWVIGRICAGERIRARYVVAVVLVSIITFGVVQGARSVSQARGISPNPASALWSGLTEYNMAYGNPQHYSGFDIVSNAVGGILYRFKGVDYFMAITNQVPERVPFQHGQTLWQPALSIIHFERYFVHLDPQYSQLSLGRYVDQVFISQQPSSDLSSQSTTYVGDLYLNFGVTGVLVGMALLGALFSLFDDLFTLKGPISAGVVAFAGLPLIGLDRNIDYVLVTSGIRLIICALLLRLAFRSRLVSRASKMAR